MKFIKNTIKSLLLFSLVYSISLYALDSREIKSFYNNTSIKISKGMELLDLETISTNDNDGEYNDVINSSKKWWVDELGFNPFINWTPPIIWNTSLKKENINEDSVILGQTFTYTGTFPLKDNYEIAYIQMDNEEIIKRDISLEKVLIHELGHALGLDHEENSSIMEPLDSNMRFALTDTQRELIKKNFELGH